MNVYIFCFLCVFWWTSLRSVSSCVCGCQAAVFAVAASLWRGRRESHVDASDVHWRVAVQHQDGALRRAVCQRRNSHGGWRRSTDAQGHRRARSDVGWTPEEDHQQCSGTARRSSAADGPWRHGFQWWRWTTTDRFQLPHLAASIVGVVFEMGELRRPWTRTGLPGRRPSAGRHRIPGRQRLRSSSTSALDVPSTRLSTVGDRAFPVAAARTWNSLPAEVTSSNTLQTFKNKLKSHLFLVSFP